MARRVQSPKPTYSGRDHPRPQHLAEVFRTKEPGNLVIRWGIVSSKGGDHAQEHAQDDQSAGPVVQSTAPGRDGASLLAIFALPGAGTGRAAARDRCDGGTA